jgi:PQQ-dependent catabolism-associated CXXCW motif protein
MRRRHTAPALLLLCAAAAEAPPAEPSGLWPGPLQGPVPATLTGATVLPTAQAAERFLAEHHALAIDASPAPAKPPAMAPGMPWLPPAHQDIPGSFWLPDAGRDVLQPERAGAYLALVARLTGNDFGRFVLVYCHPSCWASWNAAKRLVQAGYAHVAWFPPGIEGWAQADLPLQRVAPTVY